MAAPTTIGSTSAHAVNGQSTIVLPAGCTAGTWVIIADTRANTCTVTPPPGATALVSAFQLGTSTVLGDVFLYQLSATDVANGTVSYVTSTNGAWYVLTALSGANATNPVDVIGAAAVANPNVVNPISIPCNGVTTTGPNRLVFAIGFMSPTVAGVPTWTDPSGWTLEGQTTVSWAEQLAVLSMVQASAGTTPNAVIGASTGSGNLRGAGVQIAIAGTDSGGGSGSAAFASSLRLGCAVALAATLAGSISATLPKVAPSITINATGGTIAASLAAKLGTLRGAVTFAAKQQAPGTPVLGAVASRITASATTLSDTASVTARIGALASQAATSAATTVQAHGSAGFRAATLTGARMRSQAVSAFRIGTTITAGHISQALTPMPGFSMALAYRSWYAAIAYRPWYAAIPARAFYVVAD